VNAEDFDLVVVDAANVAHTTIMIDGNEERGLLPERLEALIEACESLGWKVKAFMKHGTYFWASKNTHSPLVGDVKCFERLIRSGHLELLEVANDDIWWIDFAVQHSGLIISKDRFISERKEFSDRDWSQIDASRISNFEITDALDVLIPDLPVKEGSGRQTYRSMKERMGELEERLEFLESVLKEKNLIDDELLTKATPTLTSSDDQTTVSITHAVFDQLLRDGGAVHLTKLLYILTQAHLGVGHSQQDWPEDWMDSLKTILGVEGRPGEWLEGLSPRDVERVGEHRDHLQYVQK